MKRKGILLDSSKINFYRCNILELENFQGCEIIEVVGCCANNKLGV